MDFQSALSSFGPLGWIVGPKFKTTAFSICLFHRLQFSRLSGAVPWVNQA
jgi:hypothetical protein